MGAAIGGGVEKKGRESRRGIWEENRRNARCNEVDCATDAVPWLLSLPRQLTAGTHEQPTSQPLAKIATTSYYAPTQLAAAASGR